MWFATAVLVQEDPPQLVATFALSIVVNIGMWFERYVIIVTRCTGTMTHHLGVSSMPRSIDVGVFHRHPRHFLHPVLALPGSSRCWP